MTDTDIPAPGADTVDLVALYRQMATIGAADRRAQTDASSGALAAAYYPVQGLEAVCAALGAVLERRDQLVSTYRNLGDAVAKGVPLERIVAELHGRVTGTSKGKGGPMHLVDEDAGLMMTTGIVGSGIPVAVGLGLAASLDGDGRAVAVTFGDGATSIGAFHEAMNLASLWKLPVVFVCQNNGWGEHTAVADYAAQPDLAERAAAYAMEGVRVDGFDPLAVVAALGHAVDRARRGEGPTFVECVTYRLTPHVATAEMSYMPDDELEAARRRDPVPRCRELVLERGLATAAELDDIDTAVAADVAGAFERALAAAAPEASELYTDVFSDERMVPGR